MKIALVHDSFTQYGGAERVFESIKELFPAAPVFTLVADKKFKEKYKEWNFKTSWLQTIYNCYPHFAHLLPFIPFAVNSLNFLGYDAVISSSSSFVKNIRVPKNCRHICYCHTPTRFLWIDKDYVNQEVPKGLQTIVKIYLAFLKNWDFNGAQRVTKFLANSLEVKKRIKKFYERESEVVYPGIDTNFWHPVQSSPPLKGEYPPQAEDGVGVSVARVHNLPIKKGYFLIAGRLQAHKNIEFIIKIFNELGLPLHIVGTGRQEEYLKSIAKNNIIFLGRVSDEQLRDEYSGALAFINPQIEDFGLTPLEAAACGTPTIGIAQGGNLETVAPGVTGELYGRVGDSLDRPLGINQDNLQSQIKQIILNFDLKKYSLENLRTHAEKFSKEKFKENLERSLKL